MLCKMSFTYELRDQTIIYLIGEDIDIEDKIIGSKLLSNAQVIKYMTKCFFSNKKNNSVLGKSSNTNQRYSTLH